MVMFLQFLAQMKNPDSEGKPPITGSDNFGTSGMTWIIAAVLVVGILLITFKTSRRNHLERE